MSLLEMSGVTKTFGGLTAVNQVGFDVEEGSVMGLIGPNGAGKTTVFNLITGNYTPNAGSIKFDGTEISGLQTHKIVSSGIARTFQNVELFANMTVIDNMLLGRHHQRHVALVAVGFRALEVDAFFVGQAAVVTLPFAVHPVDGLGGPGVTGPPYAGYVVVLPLQQALHVAADVEAQGL